MLDAHVHLWDLAVRDQPWIPAGSPIRRSFGLGDLRLALAGTSVDGVILVQVLNDAAETAENSAMLDAVTQIIAFFMTGGAQKPPSRFVVARDAAASATCAGDGRDAAVLRLLARGEVTLQRNDETVRRRSRMTARLGAMLADATKI